MWNGAQDTLALDWCCDVDPDNTICPSEPEPPTVGYTLHFDGVDDLVYVFDQEPPMRPENYGDFDFSTHFTIEAWIKPSTLFLGGNYAAVAQGVTAGAGGAYTFGLQNSPPGTWFLSVCVPSCNSATSPGDNLDAMRWQHVAGVYDGSSITIYRNGQEIAAESWSGDVSDVIGLVIGRWQVGSPVAFPGLVEDLRVWNTARSQFEILSTMYGGVSGFEPDLMGYWRFNEGSGQYANDSSVRGNHGQLGESPLVDAADPTWVVYDPPLVFAPSRLFVQRWDPYEPMFDCADEIKPP
ncbi:MAG: LamG domain-containing protein, partial [Acidobacteriota bacterium]